MVADWSETLKWIGWPPARKAPETDPLCAAILKRFSESHECPVDWPKDWKPVGAPLVRRHSTIYRLSSVSHRRSICIKVASGSSPESENSARLYAALRHYHARSDFESGFTVPEPYGWVPEHDAVIMEWVDGRTFSEVFKGRLFFTRKRHESIRKAAGWLAWFHSQSELQRGTTASGKRWKGIVRIYELSGDLEKGATAHDPALEECLKMAKKVAARVRNLPVDWTVLHADFKPTNLIITRSGLTVGIDFLGGKRGPVTHDICRFMSELDFYRHLLGRPPAVIQRAGDNDFDAFLSGYGRCVGGVSRETFVSLYFLTVLSAFVNQRRKFKRGAKHRIRLTVVRRIASRISNNIKEASGGMI